MESCPCGKELSYYECCRAIHLENKIAKTAEELMRSRYVAYCKANGNYLMLSQSIRTRDLTTKAETIKWAKSVKWIKLDIISTSAGRENDTTGQVEFKAHYKYKLFNRCIHERSNFIKEEGKWVYLNGTHL